MHCSSQAPSSDCREFNALTVRQKEDDQCVFKGFPQALIVFITSHQLLRGVPMCNCSRGSFGLKTTSRDGFLFSAAGIDRE